MRLVVLDHGLALSEEMKGWDGDGERADCCCWCDWCWSCVSCVSADLMWLALRMDLRGNGSGAARGCDEVGAVKGGE